MASPFDKYQNLPGVRVEYEDGNLYSDNQNLDASTKSLLIIGSASDGPVGEPISVQRLGGPRVAEGLFGGLLSKQKIYTGEVDPETGEELFEMIKVPTEGNLVRSMYEAIEAGNEDVRLLRVSGRRARTEVKVNSGNEDIDQVLGEAKGNIGFSKSITVDDSGRLSVNPVKKIVEKREDGTVIHEYTNQEVIGHLVLSVERNPGEETIHFASDKFRPGNKLDVQFNFNKRSYHEVLHTDGDGEFIQDPDMPTYFASVNQFFSNEVQLGHTVNIFVDGQAIPQVDSSGNFLWRIGKEDESIENPLFDMPTEKEFEQGGVRFTTAYIQASGSGLYPELSSSTEVKSDYFYYDEELVTLEEEYDIPGQNTTYELNYIPLDGELKVYYEVGEDIVELNPVAADGKPADYSLVFSEVELGGRVKLIIRAGVVPNGYKIKVSYKTDQTVTGSPNMIVEGLYAGDVYGSLEDFEDPNSLRGVQVDIRSDIVSGIPSSTEKIITFIKPEEKRKGSHDYALEYKTKDLKAIRTLGQFVNYVNNDPNNNIVFLTAEDGDKGLIRSIEVTNGPVFLGERLNTNTNQYELYEDEDKMEDDPDRYPWLGSNGFFNKNDLKDMERLYSLLGGKYEMIDENEFQLVEQGLYSKLENYKVDSIVLVEANANTKVGSLKVNEIGQELYDHDPEKNFATQLAQHCAVTTAKSWETIGFIGVTPPESSTLLSVQDYIDELVESDINKHFMYRDHNQELVTTEDGDPIDIGGYISVVFGPEIGMTNAKLGSYITNGAVVYAALDSALRPEVATTNKEINVRGLRYNLSEAQHSKLIDARYVTFEENIAISGAREFKVKDGLTASLPGSDYQRLTTVNIAHATVQLIRLKAQPYIGLPNGLAQRNSLSTEIQAALDSLKSRGVLQDFRFSLFTSPKEKVLGNAFISLELVPEFETRRIYTSVGLRQSL